MEARMDAPPPRDSQYLHGTDADEQRRQPLDVAAARLLAE
jgi:hypothetical protein